MKYHTALHFTTALSLDELAEIVEMDDPFFDIENEYEWVIGTCDGVDKIDVCRTHKVPPLETETSILRYAHAMESVIPRDAIKKIANRLIAHGITEITVGGFDTWGSGFLSAPVAEELGL